jgi:ABC-type dipeptide/oligopeptide/nickel transport system permease component
VCVCGDWRQELGRIGMLTEQKEPSLGDFCLQVFASLGIFLPSFCLTPKLFVVLFCFVLPLS